MSAWNHNVSYSSKANGKATNDSPETAVRRVLFIRALEEDGEDEPLSKAAERYVEDEASRNEADFERIIIERAGITQKDLERRWNITLTPLFDFDRRRSMIITASIAVIAFILGLVSNVLDRGPVNILFNAFMFLLLWHVFIYVLMIVRSVFSHRLGRFLSDVNPGPVESALSWALEKAEELLHRFTASRKAEIWHKILSAQPRFRLYLAQQFNRVLRLRVMVRLNTMAIFSTLGVVAGMYLAGLVHDYRFIWHSTFIGEPGTVSAILQVIFAPVLFVFQRPLPQLAAQGVGVPGAEWIHLFAQAAFLYVVLPRAIIVVLAQLRAKRYSKNSGLDLGDQYFSDLLRPYRGSNRTIVPLIFSFSPDDERTMQFHSLLRRRFGDRAGMDEEINLDWGDSFDATTLPNKNCAIALLFNGVQTPEHEIHGKLAGQAVTWQEEHNGSGLLAVLIDTSDLEPNRREERLKLWETVLSRAGIEKINPISLKDEAEDNVQMYVMGEES